ncbi:MAG: hypothetical protein A2Z20_09535 [Bdellovibrionales bacterium RBG_16_40_8]|nr:MAG: hypothetical protein A2Z20_09535 [Bdellovibrionales bacterium RBG_16_40_8]
MGKIFYLLLVSFLISGCGPVDNIAEPFKGDTALSKVGSQYYLSTVEHSDGQIVRPEKSDFQLDIESETTIAGKIACNAFRADVNWGSDNFVSINSMKKGSAHCQKAEPLLLPSRMRFQFSNGLLILQNADQSWVATFALENSSVD